MTGNITRMSLGDGNELAVRIDDYSVAWLAKPPIVMLHGLAESGEAFRQWVPHLAGQHPIYRPDLRGYGASTPMKADFHYTFKQLGDDMVRMLDHFKLDKVLLVGGKIGGTLAMHLAAGHRDRVIAVAAVGSPASLTSFDERAPGWRKQIRAHGVEDWVRSTTGGRLGSSLPGPALEWWIALMSKTSADTLDAFLKMVPTVDVRPELPRIACPTLVITTTGSGLGDVASVRAWQETIPGSSLEVIEGDSYHVAATHPTICAERVKRFFDRL